MECQTLVAAFREQVTRHADGVLDIQLKDESGFGVSAEVSRGALTCAFGVDTAQPRASMERALLMRVFLAAERHGQRVESVAIALDNVDAHRLRQHGSATATSAYAAMRMLGFGDVCLSRHGTQTLVCGVPSAAEPRGRMPASAALGDDARARVVARCTDVLAQRIEALPTRERVLFEEAAARWSLAPDKDARLNADVQKAMDALNDPPRFLRFMQALLSEAARIAAAAPRLAHQMAVEERIPQAAIEKALWRRTVALGFSAAAMPPEILDDDAFAAFFRGDPTRLPRLLANDTAFRRYDNSAFQSAVVNDEKAPDTAMAAVSHPSILHWVQLAYTLAEVDDPRRLYRAFGEPGGPRLWTKIFDEDNADIRMGLRFIGGYLHQTLRVR